MLSTFVMFIASVLASFAPAPQVAATAGCCCVGGCECAVCECDGSCCLTGEACDCQACACCAGATACESCAD